MARMVLNSMAKIMMITERLFRQRAGDINGDGYADLLIGAFGYPAGSDKGRSYVVFGGPGVGRSGIIAAVQS